MYVNVLNKFIYNSTNLKTIQISINRWTDKQIVHSYYGTPPSNKKQQTINIHHKMNESQNNWVEEARGKENTFCMIPFTKNSKNAN